MANAASIDAPEGAFLTVTEATAQELKLPQFSALGVYNVPADNLNSAQAEFVIAYRRTAQAIKLTQFSAVAVVKGRVGNPKLAAWGFTLDGHDLVVLRLGTERKTLVFDISTGQWSWWSSNSSARWSANIGMNWRSAGSIPQMYGSNVVVGDDSTGQLYILDPEYGMDDPPIEEGSSPGTFPRRATGQMVLGGRKTQQIFNVCLSSDVGSPVLTGDQVTLEYSDDYGQTYVTASAPIAATTGDYTTEFIWQSIGLMRAPGRLFRISDEGACARIDSLDVNE